MKFLYAILITLTLFVSHTFSQEVFVDMPQDQGYVGIPMRLVVVFQNVSSDTEPSIPPIDGFTIRRRPGVNSSQQTTFINGKVMSTSTNTYTFFLTPQHVGVIEIPSITFIADGKAFQSLSKTIEIIETPTSGALKVEVSGTSSDVYLGQPIDMTLKIYVERFTDPILGITLDAREMFTLLSKNSSFGMFSDALQNGRASVQTVRGDTMEGVPTTFYVYSLEATTWPVTTGTLELDPISIIVDYPISLAQKRRSGFFGGNSLVIDQSSLVSAQAELPTIRVLTPPLQNQPEWYTGAVGTFDFRIIAQPARANVGEPISITMRITDISSGPVNLDYLSAPALDRLPALTSNFKVPDKPLGGTVEGRTKIFTQSIRPRNDGVTEIPPLPMSSYDPISDEYVTVWTKAIPITVDAVATVTASDVVGGTVQKNQPVTQQRTEVDGGILANYVGNDLLVSQTTEFTPVLLATIALPPFVFIGCAVSLFFKRRSQSDSAMEKISKKQAMQTIRSCEHLQSKVQVQKFARALRTLQKDSGQVDNVQLLINRCDAAQFGGFEDATLIQDANKVMEAIS